MVNLLNEHWFHRASKLSLNVFLQIYDANRTETLHRLQEEEMKKGSSDNCVPMKSFLLAIT